MLIYVPLSQIDDNPFQRRVEYGDIGELAERIYVARTDYPDTRGLMQIPRGRLAGDDGLLVPISGLDAEDWLAGNHLCAGWRIQLAFGHRRKRAFDHLHKISSDYWWMPIHVGDLSDAQMLDAVWSENNDRKDISAVEQAELLKAKIEMLQANGGGSQKEVAESWGLARATVSNRLRLLELPPELQEANRKGQLSERQCLSLAPVIQLGQLANGVEWGSGIGNDRGIPAGPDEIIRKVIESPDTITSETIREHTKSMVKHAGTAVPDYIAKHNFTDLRGVAQTQCKGCSFRISQYCLKKSCIEKKQDAWPDIAIAEFSEKTGIPISDRKEDFYTNDFESRKRIKGLYDAGDTGGGMVCAWLLGVAERPCAKHDYVWRSDLGKDGRAGIAVGYRGYVPADNAEDAGPVYDMPPSEDISAWHQEIEAIVTQSRDILVNGLVDKALLAIDDWDIIQALVYDPEQEWRDDPEKLARSFILWLLQKGQGVTSFHRNEYNKVQNYQAGARRSGLGINVLGDPVSALRKTAVLILDHWYQNHYGRFWNDYAEDCEQWIEEWINQYDAAVRLAGKLLPDITEIHKAIIRARIHIRQKLKRKRLEDGKKDPSSDDEDDDNAEMRAFASDNRDAILRGEVEAGIDTVEGGGRLLAEAAGDLIDAGVVPPDPPRRCPRASCSRDFTKYPPTKLEDNHWRCSNCGREMDSSGRVPKQMDVPEDNSRSIVDAAVDWLSDYKDNHGRVWHDLTENQTWHANSPCYQAFVARFPDVDDHKAALRAARARLETGA